jgi:putative transposase
MTSNEFARKLRDELVNKDLKRYEELFQSTAMTTVSDPYWRQALSFYSSLGEAQRDTLFQIIRQTSIDTVSSVLGVLDGVIRLEGQSEGFKLTTESSSELLNQGLQDAFLELEE